MPDLRGTCAKTGRKARVLHSFFRLGDGSFLAFFEAPEHLRITIGCATETLRGGLEGLAAALAEI